MKGLWSKEGKVLEQVEVHTKHGTHTAGRWKSLEEKPGVPRFFLKTQEPGSKQEALSLQEVKARYEKSGQRRSFSEFLHKYYTPYIKGQTTAEMYKRDPAREQLHDAIVAEVVNYANTPPAGQKPIAILLGGGAASGKSYVRDTLIDPALKAGGIRVGVCDPDAMKTRLPEWNYLLENDPGSAAGITHRESLRLTESAFYGLVAQGKNLLYDKCMRAVGDYRNKILNLHDCGYNVVVIGVTTDIDTALERAHMRERQLPDSKIRETHSGFATAWEFIKDYADDYQLYDSTTGSLELVENIHGVQNHDLMEAFHDRGKNGDRRRTLKKIADRYGADLEPLWDMYKGGMDFESIRRTLKGDGRR